MKKTLLIIGLVLVFTNAKAQKIYSTTCSELIFGFSNAEYKAPSNFVLPYRNINGSITDAMRFTAWFHFGAYWHYDFNKYFGVYTGVSNRNLGFITKESSTLQQVTELVKWKRRAYAIGAPVVLKLGNMDRDFYFFAGAQYEFLYHYKEKEFRPDPEGKRKYTEWFSDRLNMLLPSMFLGVTFPEGHSMKITIALNDMMNKDYSFVSSQGANIRPYEYMSSQLIYISYFKMVRWEKSTYKKVIEEKRQFAER